MTRRAHRTQLLLVLVTAGASTAVLADRHPHERRPTDTSESTALVSPDGTGGNVRPNTSRTRPEAGRTLAPTVVVRGEPDQARPLLVSKTDADRNQTAPTTAIRSSPCRESNREPPPYPRPRTNPPPRRRRSPEPGSDPRLPST